MAKIAKHQSLPHKFQVMTSTHLSILSINLESVEIND